MKKETLHTGNVVNNLSVNAHLDIKLEGWAASAVLITFCLSGVAIYGLKVWSDAAVKCA